jgi:3-methylcrotonyl-CoA carboxylase alpha subunit
MGQAAVAAAKAVGYVGAGTVEFIANQDGSFYFMEMNTRLQVEHPVTEMITGTDLVEWQLRVAAGERLPLRQDELAIRGHALEARIYAENPDKGFLPSIGTLRRLRTPAAAQFELGTGASSIDPASVRIDSGVREGDAISPFYDPMIAKLIVWGRDRNEALARMSQALAEYQLVGLATNVAFLKRLVESEPFSNADLDTSLIERHRDSLFPPAQPTALPVLALATALLLDDERHPGALDPWSSTNGWRMNGALTRRLEFGSDAGVQVVELGYGRQGWSVQTGGQRSSVSLLAHDDTQFTIRLDDAVVCGNVMREGENIHVFSGGRHVTLHYGDPLAHAGELEAEGGRLTAPMPGKIVALLTEKGASVEKGAPLLIMEAMKMEHTITAPASGIVEELLYAVGDQVSDGVQLLTLKAA